jgi:hypothetical protein
MDYSSKVIDGGVMDNPPGQGPILVTMSSSFSLLGRKNAAMYILNSAPDSGSSQKLYALCSSPIQCGLEDIHQS